MDKLYPLKSDRIDKRVLCIAEGEGINALFLPSEGFRVHAVDMSYVGLQKLSAEKQGLGDLISVEVVNITTYDYLFNSFEGWDMIVEVFVPIPSLVKTLLANKSIKSLKPGGYLVSVTYHPTNIGRGTGNEFFH
jgi:2-polyprenyl-3-methyl-5-hydroxy-6-metoxy-1,4-benzoquinol methylase